MPKITAYAKLFRDWEGLLGACAQNAATLQGTDTLKAELEDHLSKGREAKVQQEGLASQRTVMTQQLGEIEDAGSEAARKLRALVLSQLGSRTEALKQFGLVPKPKRPRKTKTPEVKPPVEPAPEPPKPAEKAVEKAEP